MNEIYKDVSDEVKEIARLAWSVAVAQKDPLHASNFLHSVTEFYKQSLTEEEIEFLQFYFNLQMEMMKK